MPSSRESGRTQSQRQSPRTPLQLRTSSSESDGHHPPNRRAPDRVASRLADRRTHVRAPIVDTKSTANGLSQKKRAGGLRMGDMESQLRQAQDEIKKLQTRLAAFEGAKVKEEEEQAHVDDDGDTDKMKTVTSLSNINADSTAHVSEVVNTSAAVLEEEKSDIQRPVLVLGDAKDKDGSAAVKEEEIVNSGQEETDVFEVPLTPLLGASPESVNKQEGERSEEKFPVPEKEDVPMMLIELRARLVEKEEEVQKLVAESQVLKKQAEEKEADARREEEEAAARVRAEMEEMRKKVGETEEALAEERSARAGMEEEMKRMRVQTEQWRKAADAAAEVLAEGGGGSMDSRNLFGYAVGGMGRYARQGLAPPSPPDIELEGGGKKKGGGGSVVVKGLGDLWKKKHHHHHK